MRLKLLTDIFPPDIKPVHEGWYPAALRSNTLRTPEGWCMCYWKGKWMWPTRKSSAYPTGLMTLNFQERYWRGLAINLEDVHSVRRGDNYLAYWPGVFVNGAEVE